MSLRVLVLVVQRTAQVFVAQRADTYVIILLQVEKMDFKDVTMKVA